MKLEVLKKTFSGEVDTWGDDGYCHGVHLALKNNDKTPAEIIDWLDKLDILFHGEKIEITIIAKVVKR